MYSLKLFDIILQCVAFATAITLWMVFGAYGYFYWILVGLSVWIIVSSVIHLLGRFKIGTFRIFIWAVLGFLILIAAIYLITEGNLAKLNYFFRPFAFVVIIGYIILTVTEFQEVKSKGEENIDF